MAKFGEGDSRWIVQDRPDGTNVHNWHWSETDCLEWSRTQLKTSLQNLTLPSSVPTITLKTTTVTKLDGEAYVNIRKGKIIPGYELNIVLAWEGEMRGEDDVVLVKGEGTVEIPYLSDENAGEDPEVRITFSDEGQYGKVVKKAFYDVGRGQILEKVREYVDSMARGGPCREELEVKKVGPPGPKAEEVPVVKKEEKKKEEVKERKGYKSVKMTERFRCRARDLWEIMMDENRWKGFTQSNAKISKEVGGEISIFDGAVSGSNLELEEGKVIAQKWRFGNWPDGVFSTVRLTFEEPEPGVTDVKLVQTGVPEEDRYGNETVVENTERGWRDLIFQRIRAIFGFGL